MNQIEKIADVVGLMDNHLRTELLKKDGKIQKKKLWENTYIKHQIDKRKNGGVFPLNEHIQAMVYAMLSSGISWERVESGIDEETGKIIPIDEIFHQYDSDILLSSSPEELSEKIKLLSCASQSTRKQMNGLIHTNISKLKRFEEEYGTVDNYYKKYIVEDSSMKLLVKTLADSNSKNKMVEMGEALIAEYLRNVGYDITKPDRHIRRILGSKVLACSDSEIVPIDEAFDIVKKLADEIHKPVAEVDYILWSYCAKGYGEICTGGNPKCDRCKIKQYCKRKDKKLWKIQIK